VSGVELSGLFIYPLKSARGIALQRAELTPRGLLHDRRLMVVDSDGLFLTQRTHPSMARLATALEGSAQGARLRVTFDDLPPLEVPLTPQGGAPREVRVFRDSMLALDQGEEPAAFFTRALGQPVRLVYMPDDTRRSVARQYAEEHDIVSFADGFPYLLANEASLADLNTRLATPVPMNRFRPNLVVRGAAPFAEDGWARLRIGDAQFEVRKPCVRCAIITTDQETGERPDKEPLRTLASFHTWQGKSAFAQNVLWRSGSELRVGDKVVVLT
jgi:uncharacterized protein YcbX